MTPHERSIRQQLKDDFLHYAPRCLKIRTKAGEVLPFELNQAQEYLHAKLETQKAETGRIRALVLKGRQQGCSTYTEGRFYWKVTHRIGVRAFILTHEAESTQALFEMAERYHDKCPALVKPSTGKSNAKELVFDKLDSGYRLGTAGNKAVGRGTTIQYFHGSEVAFWPHASEHAKGIMQAIPDEPDTEVILESTANGVGNYFHQQWRSAEIGESDFIAVFLPWFWQAEYRKPVPDDFQATDAERVLAKQFGLDDGQLLWRRRKIIELSVDGVDGEKSFKQEYPLTAAEAFQATGEDGLIQPEPVMAARKAKRLATGPLKIGVDPARYGQDRTSIIRRRNGVAYKLESYKHKNTMEVAGIVNAIIKNEKPDQVAIDIGGLGAGIVDRLWELGHKDIVVGVNAGSTANLPDRYVNKRAEMWGEMSKWLNDPTMPASIPDSDSLQADLCMPRFTYDSNSRLVIEQKEQMKKRSGMSPDEAEALCQTFAEPIKIKRKQIPRTARIVGDRHIGY